MILLFPSCAPDEGYNYNARSGSRYALMNTEFRFPLFRYIVLGAPPLAFQNVLGVLFLDVGTAWTHNKNLQLFTRKQGTLLTKDLLLGMGIGARIALFYMPFKFDVAWSYNLNRFSKPRFLLSMGADF
jgi:outer membrane protein assembly factor BamA